MIFGDKAASSNPSIGGTEENISIAREEVRLQLESQSATSGPDRTYPFLDAFFRGCSDAFL